MITEPMKKIMEAIQDHDKHDDLDILIIFIAYTLLKVQLPEWQMLRKHEVTPGYFTDLAKKAEDAIATLEPYVNGKEYHDNQEVHVIQKALRVIVKYVFDFNK